MSTATGLRRQRPEMLKAHWLHTNYTLKLNSPSSVSYDYPYK